MSAQTCAVCGQGGYWVGYDELAREDRCLNHVEMMRTSHLDRAPIIPDSRTIDLEGVSGE